MRTAEPRSTLITAARAVISLLEPVRGADLTIADVVERAERGALLRVEATIDGAPFHRLEVTAIDFGPLAPPERELAGEIPGFIRESMPARKTRYPGVEALNVAVMGCIVNGPGESKHADIGISLPGTFEEPVAPVFVDGEKTETLRGEAIVPRFLEILDDYVERRYPAPGATRPALLQFLLTSGDGRRAESAIGDAWGTTTA